MPYETSFPWTSETTDFPASMQYLGDPLRVYTNVFYDLGYRLSQLLQIQGSYLGNQIFFVILLWARGWLLYLGLAALLPEAPWLAFLSGTLALAHGADFAAMWVGQMNQLGYMFWLLLAFHALVRATEGGENRHRNRYAALALASCYLCLYSYESPIFLVGLVPVLLAAVSFDRVRNNLLLFLLWYSIPAALAWRFLRRWYLSVATYQSMVMRKDFDAVQILGEWAGQVRRSLEFWNWRGASEDSGHAVYGYAAAAIFALTCYVLYRAQGFAPVPERRIAWRILPFGLAVCILSFPAYLFLVGGGGFWRTQFLASLGAGVIMASVLLLAATAIGRAQVLAMALAGAIAVQAGVHALVDTSKRHLDVWERHRTVFAQMLAAAPQIRAGSMVVLSGVPRGADPFGDNMWFDLGVRLAYPGTAVSGIYYLADGSRSVSQSHDLAPGGELWTWNGQSIQPLLRKAAAAQTLFFEMSPDGKLSLVRTWPEWLAAAEAVKQAYDPETLIVDGAPSPIAVNRFGPLAHAAVR